jgi:hypothetical protein
VDSVRLSRRLRATDVVTDLLRLVALGSLVVGILLYPVNAVVAFAVVLVIMLVPRVAELPRPVDLAVCITWLVAGWAKVAGWYVAVSWLDFVVHGVTTGTSAAALYLLLVRIGLVPPLQDPAIRRAGIVLLTTALGMSIGVLWEFYEWIAYANLPGRDYVGYTDTVADLLMDTLSSLAAGIGLAVWASFGWRTRRLRTRDVQAAVNP